MDGICLLDDMIQEKVARRFCYWEVKYVFFRTSKVPLVNENNDSMNRFLLCLMYSLIVEGCVNEQPKPVSDPPREQNQQAKPTLQIPTFSGARAFELLVQQTRFGPRNPGSSGHAACREFLANEMRKYADDVKLQEFSHIGYQGERFQLTNIVASFNPNANDRILLCAHWDTRPRAENDEDTARRHDPIIGANDGASGVAVLLELASLFKQRRPQVGVELILFDGEDYGMEGDIDRYLLGSRHFALNKPANYSPRFGILIDMVGDKFLDIPKEQHSSKYALDIVEMVWNKARELGYPQFTNEVGDLITDDHLPLNEVGIKTIDLIDFNYPDPTNRFWHSHKDIPENCSAESLEAVGTVLTHVVFTQIP
jgi:glutaminyl-peptide cyclotransferase